MPASGGGTSPRAARAPRTLPSVSDIACPQYRLPDDTPQAFPDPQTGLRVQERSYREHAPVIVGG